MPDLFISGSPYQEGQDEAARTALTNIQAADAMRKAQQDIALDQATRSALRNVTGAPPAATAAPMAPAAATGGTPSAPTMDAAPPGGEARYADRLASMQQSTPATAAPTATPSVSPPAPGMSPAPDASAPALPTAAPALYGPTAASASRQALTTAYANTPGGGSAASQMHFSDLAAQTDVMHQVFSLAEKDPEGALRYAEQAGMPVPPELHQMLGNRAAVQTMNQVFDQAKALYPNEIDAPAKWSYIQGRIHALAAQPGNPVAGNPNAADTGLPPTSKPFYEPQQAMVTEPSPAPGVAGAPHIGVFDPNKALTNPGSAVTDTGVAGVPRGFSSAARAMWLQGTPQQRLLSMWLAQPGHETDVQGARDFIAGAKAMTPQQMQVAAHNEAARDVGLKYSGALHPPAPDQVSSEIAALSSQYFTQMQQLASQPRPQAMPQDARAPQAQPSTTPGDVLGGTAGAPLMLPLGSDGKTDARQLLPNKVYWTRRGAATYLGNGQFRTIQ